MLCDIINLQGGGSLNILKDYSIWIGEHIFKSVEDVQREMYAAYQIVYNTDQLTEIAYGIKNNVDVLWYLDPAHDAARMRQIRLGLESNLNVSIYAKPVYVSKQMNEIRLGLSEGLNVSVYAKSEIPWDMMKSIRESMNEGLDVSEIMDILK